MTPKENLIRTLTVDNPEWIPDMLKDFKFVVPIGVLNEMGMNNEDWFGVHWTAPPSAGMIPQPAPTAGREPLKDISQWREKVIFPDLDALDWDEAAKQLGVFESEGLANYMLVPIGIFERVSALMGMQNAFIAMLTDPEEYDALVEAITQFKIKLYGILIDRLNISVISHSDDFGSRLGMLISPEAFRRFFKPRLKRIADAIHAKGAIAMMHCCGKIDDIVDDFVECGFDGWESCEVCNDLDGIYEKYGDRFSFCGAMNAQALNDNPNTTEDDAKKELRTRIDQLGGKGGFIPGYLGLDPKFYPVLAGELATYGAEFTKKRLAAR